MRIEDFTIEKQGPSQIKLEWTGDPTKKSFVYLNGRTSKEVNPIIQNTASKSAVLDVGDFYILELHEITDAEELKAIFPDLSQRPILNFAGSQFISPALERNLDIIFPTHNEVVVAANAEPGPDLQLKAEELETFGLGGFHAIGRTDLATTVGLQYVVSVFGKMGPVRPSGHKFLFFSSDIPTTLGNIRHAHYDIRAGTLGSIDAFHDSHSIDVGGNSYFRCNLVMTASTTRANNTLWIGISNADGVVFYNETTDIMFLDQFEFKLGAVPSSVTPLSIRRYNVRHRTEDELDSEKELLTFIEHQENQSNYEVQSSRDLSKESNLGKWNFFEITSETPDEIESVETEKREFVPALPKVPVSATMSGTSPTLTLELFI